MDSISMNHHGVHEDRKPAEGSSLAPEPHPVVGASRGVVQGPGNLESVFISTCPFVPVHHAQETGSRSAAGSEAHFRLDEFWQSFEEWSAYGAGVPVRLASGQMVQQYYSPYLSGIQLFAAGRSPRQRTSDGGDSDSEGQSTSSASFSTDISTCGSDSEEESSAADSGGGARAGGKGTKSVLRQCLQEPSRMLFEFFEKDAPHTRVPLTDKVEALAAGEGGFPGLTSLTSVDLHPASWVSVAWYPLYRVPAGRHVRDLGAAFLTYHSLSLAPGEGGGAPRGAPFDARPAAPQMSPPAEAAMRAAAGYAAERLPPAPAGGATPAPLVPLRPFAYHGYKSGGRLWTGGSGSKALVPMVSAAEAWVQRRGCRHKDYEFFSRCPVTY